MAGPEQPTEQQTSARAFVARAFVAWAQAQAVALSIPRQDDNYDDLGFLPAVIGHKRVVAVGESAHYLHEWNRWRARLFKYLVLEHGFTTFVLESGLVEGRLVHDYVAGADHDWDDVAAAINNVWGVWAEINELIRWMREWNQNPDRPRELRFYGMDGTGNWAHARYAYRAVHDFALGVDQVLADDIARDFEGAVAEVTLETRTEISPAKFRDLIGAASLIVSRIEQARIAYTAASSHDDYDWGLRCGQIMRDVFLTLGQTEADFEIGLRQFWNVRDVSMAESLRWIREREGTDAGMVLGAHNTHLQLHPVRTQKATSMGSYFASRFGREDILFIGTTSERSVKGEPPRPDSNQAAYAEIKPDCYFLDLRAAPKSGLVADWLAVERPDRTNLRYQPVCAGAAWDCLLFHRTLSTGTVERPGYLHSPPAEDAPDDLERFSGRYIIHGFLAAVNTLDVFCKDGTLYTDGQDDTSGEVFPPYKVPLHFCQDGRFRWTVWPSILEFHPGKDGVTVSVATPGGALYLGKRIGDAVGG
ncbi:MAG: erythromycin esterase family protein [Rhodospirillaceae bacterium]|jgi:erythromycin esterase|nr:erythromycin esterase family protein [Rhodospirillaceae bacterium]MBT5049396.1 erythromycin esterase family protein [Rhodospirillaceae bacterium]MBT5895858.1 erythromycin esterase family protein [Rhodospirillaceae bacterium]MBT6429511.1 erythromycin esterase family protein [Rhodospirillaceae bacterium]MBT7757150.1 erythromycin esterase family protein [Rhodospirillaceae bacterium]